MAALAILAALNLPTHLGSSAIVDGFHEGETMGTAVSIMHGRAPYRDIIFLHGPYQDPLRSILAFRLMGRSTGAVRSLESIHKIVAFILMAMLCLVLFPGRPALATVLFLTMALLHFTSRLGLPNMLILSGRDIMTFAFLICCACLENIDFKSRSRPWALALMTFGFCGIAITAFAYSVDRGFFLSAAMLLLLPAIWFRMRTAGQATIFTLSSIAAIAIAAGIIYLSIQGQIKPFFVFVFKIMPKYKELMDGKIFPINQPRFLLFCTMIAACTYLVFLKILQHWTGRDLTWSEKIGSIAKNHLSLTAMALLSVFYFRSSLGRSDWSHIICNAHASFLLAAKLLIDTFSSGPNRNKIYKGEKVLKKFLPALFMLVLVITGFRCFASDLIRYNFPLSVADYQMMRPQDVKTVAYLKAEMNPDDEFYTLTSEGMWYYWLDCPSPTRHAIAWFAMPVFYQEEIVHDLERKKVRFILLKNNYWSSAIDQIPIERRLPIVVKYIKKHYMQDRTIGDNQLWVRKFHFPEQG